MLSHLPPGELGRADPAARPDAIGCWSAGHGGILPQPRRFPARTLACRALWTARARHAYGRGSTRVEAEGRSHIPSGVCDPSPAAWPPPPSAWPSWPAPPPARPAPCSTVTPAEASTAIDEGATVIDVRTPAEFAAGHIPDAVNIDVESSSFADDIAELDQSETYVVYCRTGRRSALAADQMAEAGFSSVKDLGGLSSWANAGYPVVT